MRSIGLCKTSDFSILMMPKSAHIGMSYHARRPSKELKVVTYQYQFCCSPQAPTKTANYVLVQTNSKFEPRTSCCPSPYKHKHRPPTTETIANTTIITPKDYSHKSKFEHRIDTMFIVSGMETLFGMPTFWQCASAVEGIVASHIGNACSAGSARFGFLGGILGSTLVLPYAFRHCNCFLLWFVC